MLADDRRNVVCGERIFGQHHARTARVALLAGLEQTYQRALEVALGGKRAKHAVEHGRMYVVAAGVHHAAR